MLCLQSRDKISKHLHCLDNKRWRHSAALHIYIFTSSTFMENKEISQLFGQICVNAQGSDSHCIASSAFATNNRDSKLPVVKETHCLLKQGKAIISGWALKLYISLICKENNVKTESTFITSFQTSKPQSPIKQLCHTFRIALQMVKTVPEK